MAELESENSKRRRLDSYPGSVGGGTPAAGVSHDAYLQHDGYATHEAMAAAHAGYPAQTLPPPPHQAQPHAMPLGAYEEQSDPRTMALPSPNQMNSGYGGHARYGAPPPPPPPPPHGSATAPNGVYHQHPMAQHPMHHEQHMYMNHPPPPPPVAASTQPSPTTAHPSSVPSSAGAPPPPPPPGSAGHGKSRSPHDYPQSGLRPLAVPSNGQGPPQVSPHEMAPQSAGGMYGDASPNGINHGAIPLSSAQSETSGGPSNGYVTSPVSTSGMQGALTSSAPSNAGNGSRDYGYGAPYVTTYPSARRKAIRAAQACDNCRSRKAKCDEGRPSCTFCRETGQNCVYREVPPPKQDRTLIQILDEIRDMKTELHSVREVRHEQAALGKRLQHIESQDRGIRVTLEDSNGEPKFDGASRGMLLDLSQKLCQDDKPIAGVEVAPNVREAFRRQNRSFKPDTAANLLTIPIVHTTAAHKLLRWPMIKALITPTVGNEEYVMQAELNRGPLRVWGRGEGRDPAEGLLINYGGMWTEEMINNEDENVFAPSLSILPNGGWGYGLTVQPELRSVGRENVGGLNGDGSLKLDPHTAKCLFDSYLRNIHILHPFLDSYRVGQMVLAFGAKYGSSNNSTDSPYYPPSQTAAADSRWDAHPGVGRLNHKRKLSTTGFTGSGSPGSSRGSFASAGSATSKAPERSISSALVLLVLALGKVCENGKWLQGPIKEAFSFPSSASPVHQTESPPVSVKQSPGSMGPVNGTGPEANRVPPLNLSPTSEKPAKRNVDVVPGLAYYAYATDILGNFPGESDLPVVHAGLLAALYAGQLGRVLESWSWIHWACTKCQVIFHSGHMETDDEARKNVLYTTFWTCLQLESDILAELDLPPSGISRFEETVGWPESNQNTDSELFMYFYGQIMLRKLLNRVHSAPEYNPKNDPSKHHYKKAFELEEIALSIARWRDTLPERLKWKDSDPPPSEINAARLRAKYWGAQYIVHRPFLQRVLYQSMEIEAGRPGGSQDDGLWNVRSLDDLDDRLKRKCKACIDAAIRSTEAFHGIKGRPVVTNIFGTAHAQFGNLLVLQASARSPILSPLVPKDHLNSLLNKTIIFLRNLAPISPSLKLDADILDSCLHGNNGVSSAEDAAPNATLVNGAGGHSSFSSRGGSGGSGASGSAGGTAEAGQDQEDVNRSFSSE